MMHNIGDVNTRKAAGASLASIDLNLLVALQALLEEASVTGAALRVGVSQPAMSHSLRRLRKLFGDELLVRRGRISELTPRAHTLIGPLRDVLRETEKLVHGQGFDPATDDRAVTVALTSSSAQVIGRRLVHTMRELAPHMKLRLRIARTEIDEMFATDQIDVALLPRALPTKYRRESLYRDSWVVISGQSDLTEENVLEALRTRPHILYDTGGTSYAYDVLHAHGIDVEVCATVSDSLVLADLVAAGPFIALHLEQVVRSLPKDMPLTWVPLPFTTGASGMDLAWSPWLSDQDFTDWFREILRSCTPE